MGTIQKMIDKDIEKETLEIDLAQKYHEGFRDGLAEAEKALGGQEQEHSAEKYREEGFYEALKLLCEGEFGFDPTASRANTRRGIIRYAAKTIRTKMSCEETGNPDDSTDDAFAGMNAPEDESGDWVNVNN